MPINPLSVPNFSVTPYSGGADFSQLAKLGDVYQEGQMQNRRLAVLGQMGNDPTQNAMLMIKSQDPDMVKTGLTLMNQLTVQQRMSEDLQLKKEAAEKDTTEYRKQTLKDANIDPNAPTSQEYIATGQNFPNRRAGLGPMVWREEDDPKNPGEKIQVPYLQTTGGELIPAEAQGAKPGRFLTPGEISSEKSMGAATGKAQGAARVAYPDVMRSTDSLVDNIDAILGDPDINTYIGKGSLFTHIPGTKGYGFRQRVEQLKGQGLQQNMQSLRGAGLGSLSDYEQRSMLQGFGRLAQAQTPEDFKTALNDIRKNAVNIQNIAANKAVGKFIPEAPAETKPAPPASTAIATPKSEEEYKSLPSGARYRHPDDPPGKFRTKK
jgi:hypothetical protein